MPTKKAKNIVPEAERFQNLNDNDLEELRLGLKNKNTTKSD